MAGGVVSEANQGAASYPIGFECFTNCSYRAGPNTTLIIMDGHAPHMTPKLLKHCINNNIICLCLPPHSSHLLQRLDVTLFIVLAHAYWVELDKLQRRGRMVVNKGEFWR